MAKRPLSESVILLDSKVGALHQRLDRVDNLVVSELALIKADVKLLLGEMNRSKGALAIAWVVMGVVGSGATLLVNHFLK